MAYCTVCGTEVTANYCPQCGKKTVLPPFGPGGAPFSDGQNPPPVRPPVYHNPYAGDGARRPFYMLPSSAKDRVIALLLCIFLGWLGVHHFYVGRVGYGLLYLFTFGLLGVGWLVDTVLTATGSYKDAYGLPLRETYI